MIHIILFISELVYKINLFLRPGWNFLATALKVPFLFSLNYERILWNWILILGYYLLSRVKDFLSTNVQHFTSFLDCKKKKKKRVQNRKMSAWINVL